MSVENSFIYHYSVVLNRIRDLSNVLHQYSNSGNYRNRNRFVRLVYNTYNIPPWRLMNVPPKKSSGKSVELRMKGNDQYFQGNHHEAVIYFNQSLLYATGEEDFYLAYGSRSLINFLHGSFRESIMDINQALKMNIPSDYRCTLLRRKGVSLCKLGKHKEASECFERCLLLCGFSKNEEEERVQLIDLNEKCLNTHVESTNSIEEVCNCEYAKRGTVLLNFSEEFGRHMLACRNIMPGEIILTEEPIVSVLLPKNYLTHCYYCLKRSNSLIPCKSCCHVMFCDELCLRKSWQKYHEKECPMMFHLLQLHLDPVALLTVRTLLCIDVNIWKQYTKSIGHNPFARSYLRRSFPRGGEYSLQNYSNIYHMEGHADKRKIAEQFRGSVMAKIILECLRTNPIIYDKIENEDIKLIEDFFGAIIVRHLQNFSCNTHSVSEFHISKNISGTEQIKDHEESSGPNGFSTSSFEVGLALNTSFSVLNHSCDPNVLKLNHNGHTLVLIAIRPIKIGDQLFDCYGCSYATHSKNRRQAMLREKYFFQCKCIACLNDWPLNKNTEIPFEDNMRCLECGDGPLIKVKERTETENEIEMYFCKCSFENVDISKRLEEIKMSSQKFHELRPAALNGGTIDFEFFVKYLVLLDENLLRPFKEYFECQMVIEHMYRLQCNCIHFS